MTTAKTARPSLRCSECGTAVAKWVGRCPECQGWGTIVEQGKSRIRTEAAAVTAPAVPIATVGLEDSQRTSTDCDELDRVLGGGLVPGAVVLLAGEPGVGKSTLLLDIAARCASPDRRSLVISGEESAAQVRMRAERIDAISDHLYLAAETDLGAVLTHIEQVRPALLIVDSVQTIAAEGIDGQAGGVAQIREVAAALIRTAKDRGIATILVGHVTKDGSIAGPRQLEHLVDVVLQFEGDRHSRLRMVRAVKNRFGATDEVGCFDLADDGIHELPDPSGVFMTRRFKPEAGSCVTVTLEGRRPLVAEVQALVSPTSVEHPRRAVGGLDSSRVAIALAVVERRAQLPLARKDVFVSTVGGVKLTEPATDLAVALAVTSAASGQLVPHDLIALGEVGLAGDIRAVPGLERRLIEAARLGFTRALVPVGTGVTAPEGMRLIEVLDLGGALKPLLPDTRAVKLRSVIDM